MTKEYSKGQTKLDFAAYSSHGVVYSIVLRYEVKGEVMRSAMYVPSVTYACTFDGNSHTACITKSRYIASL